MLAYAASSGVTSLKVITLTPGNPGRGLPLAQAALLLVEAATGSPLALLEGTYLTALGRGAAAGLRPGRQSADEITLFKSVGNAAQDLVLAREVYRRAQERGLGKVLDAVWPPRVGSGRRRSPG